MSTTPTLPFAAFESGVLDDQLAAQAGDDFAVMLAQEERDTKAQ
jgi:hypothetical protein